MHHPSLMDASTCRELPKQPAFLTFVLERAVPQPCSLSMLPFSFQRKGREILPYSWQLWYAPLVASMSFHSEFYIVWKYEVDSEIDRTPCV